MQSEEYEDIELDLFLESIYKIYGYDFRQYARASIKRRVRNLLINSEFEHISELIPKIIYDKNFFRQIVYRFSVSVTEMFRDPNFYVKVREVVLPYLRTFPFIKIWHAGCATGEEVYSLAILLAEEDLYNRTTIFATDFNDVVLQKAKAGIYSIDHVKAFTANYQKSGGKESFSDYYYAEYDSVIIDNSLRERITFANHNLVTDGVFGEMHLIFCRNVLIYFNRELQTRVLKLFYESLARNGFLCLGNKESIQFLEGSRRFRTIDSGESIYQKKL